ncbi:MAG TPA: type II toxin-antitoxin system VapC family toxin [Tepidisphaeraceae bacterium]|mgnify:CR=1 FL=1|nr:type II toxin-antitoxin system VapC family toxin [Tepidisphaeraceae bacterium]
MMASEIVVDASAVLAWILNEPEAETVEVVLRDTVRLVPPIWKLEVTNAIAVRHRRKLITFKQAAALLGTLDQFRVSVVDPFASRSMVELLTLASPHQLSIYDAAYLALASDRKAPLLTLDKNLAQAAVRWRVPLQSLP